MSTEYENKEKVAALPQEGVHCFAASSRQINVRRVITVILFAAFAALSVFFFTRDGGLGLGIMCAGAAVIAVLVFLGSVLTDLSPAVFVVLSGVAGILLKNVGGKEAKA